MGVPQYLRTIDLIVADDVGNGLDITQLAIKFVVHHGTFAFPHTADIRIYNLSAATGNRIGTEFTKLRLLAGYLGNHGIIFEGAIKQVRKGRENATDTYVDISAADGDQMHNWGVINTTLPAGYSQQNVWQVIGDAAAPYNSTQALQYDPNSPPAPRGKVLYGPIRDHIRTFANTNQQTVTVDQGVLTALPLLAYKQTDIIELNVLTGMLGVPEQTEQGIAIMCLLNPAITWGSRIKINNRDIVQNVLGNDRLKDQVIAGLGNPVPVPPLDKDGLYRVLTVDHIGETRGEPWYSEIICVSIDPTTLPPTKGSFNLNVGLPTGLDQGAPGGNP